jgi:hypothetical protein
MHVLGHLSDALIALGDDESTRKHRLGEWHNHLLARDSAIDTIESKLQSRLSTVSGAARSALEDELTFLNNNKDRMRYAGLPRWSTPQAPRECSRFACFRARKLDSKQPDST